jgi:hypothetical protein
VKEEEENEEADLAALESKIGVVGLQRISE